MEDILLKSIKGLLQTPGLIKRWLEVYATSNHSEIPALEGKIKTNESETEQKKRRSQNLVARVSELPLGVPADGFYRQIQELNKKVIEPENLRKNLLAKSASPKGNAIDKIGLIEKLKSTIARLEEPPKENRRPLYSNLIEFAELHPTQIRVGLKTPTLPPTHYKAAGTVSKYRKPKGSSRISGYRN